VILVAVAVVLGIILLVKGGGVGFDSAETDLTIESGEEQTTVDEVTTTSAPETPSTVAPASLKVVALNGAGINGYAGAAQQFLSVAGYTDTSAATAANQTATTVIYYAPGFDADAAAIASLFGLEISAVQPLPEGTQLTRDPAEFPADTSVAVWLGPDVQNTVEGAGGGTATTVAGGATTTTTG
jgi:hypothetical protein